jgi:hypothetical protein
VDGIAMAEGRLVYCKGAHVYQLALITNQQTGKKPIKNAKSKSRRPFTANGCFVLIDESQAINI